jgi:N-acetyl-anhydromuramyl-L-alanine amidase AmpD
MWMPPDGPRPLALLVALCLGGTLACDAAEVPTGPPRCEPESEVWVERLLKEGWRAHADGDGGTAEARFRQVLELAPEHPEALRGLAEPPETPPAPAPATPQVIHYLRFADQRVPVTLPVRHDRFAFETLRELLPARRALFPTLPAHTWYGPRTASFASANKPGAIDLVVLHDTRTLTAAEAFAAFEASGASTHFIIDADGTVHQTLDLAQEANHTQRRELDVRSVAIDLVNPVDLDRAPFPPRPVSEFVSLQGQEPVQHHGYTQAQLDALRSLLSALCGVLRELPCTVPPTNPDRRVARELLPNAATFQGIAGHLHLQRSAFDPGAGFPWENFTELGPQPRP